MNFAKVLLLTETWLDTDINNVNINNYLFVSSPRIIGRGVGVGIYINNSVKYNVKAKSIDHILSGDNIDYILIKLTEHYVALCCMYCSPLTKQHDIIALLKNLKSCTNKSHFVAGGNLLLIC